MGEGKTFGKKFFPSPKVFILTLSSQLAQVVLLFTSADDDILAANGGGGVDNKVGVLDLLAVEGEGAVGKELSCLTLGRTDLGVYQNVHNGATLGGKVRNVLQTCQQVVYGNLLDVARKKLLADANG